jgi:tRNA threonylcarbamoyladenosine biosynthesis protein TsaB
MLVLTIRSDKPEAELGLYDDKQLSYLAWQAHRELAETIHRQIQTLFEQTGLKLEDVKGLVVFKGPGSFTGLRIGLSVANALAAGLNVPIVSETGEDWIKQGLARLQAGANEEVALPEYGAPPRTTMPKK